MDYKRTPMQAEIHSFEPGSITYSLAESFYTNFKLQDIGLSDINLSNLVLAYGDHHGKKELRELIAKEAGVNPEEVLITAGTAMALFIVNTALLKSGDRVVGEHPNFAINLEVPRLAGTKIEHLDVKFEQGFKPKIADIEAALETETKVLTVATPHNPSGISLTEGELKAIVELTKKKNTYLIVDEIFREFAYDNILPVAATLGSHVISVSSLSKSFGLPGIRIGWIICRDPVLMEKFLAAKEQIVICGSVVDEEIAYQFVKKKHEFLPKIKAAVEENREVLKEWFKQQGEYLEWVEPQVGVICFPRLKSTDKEKIEEFYTVLLKEYKTLVAPGHWFDMERRHFRIGYGSPSKTELLEGLECVSKALRKVFSN